MNKDLKNNNAKSIVIIKGGWGLLPKERSHSIDYGNSVSRELNVAGIDVIDIECNNAIDILNIQKNDNVIVYNCLYGRFGEDGAIPSILEFLRIPYTGSGPFASALSFDKTKCSIYLDKFGLKVPDFILIDFRNNIITKRSNDGLFSTQKFLNLEYVVYHNLNFPKVVKPNSSAFSEGVYLVNDENELTSSIDKAKHIDKKILIQDFIEGTNVHVPVLSGEPLSPIEGVPKILDGPLSKFSFYSPNKTYLIPPNLSKSSIRKLKEFAKIAHKAIGCRGLSRSDFRVTAKGQIYFLEINVQHSIRPNSMALQSAMSCGLKAIDLIDKIIKDAWIPCS